MAKQTIEIKLYMSELVYDVQQKAHLIGDAMRTDETSEQAAKVQDLTDERKDAICAHSLSRMLVYEMS